MNSMTGYGKAYYSSRKQAVNVEISSVNNRFLEYMIRLPRDFGSLEPKVKELIGERIHRGKVNISVSFEEYGTGIDRLVLNKALAREIYSQLQALKKAHRLGGDIDINHFLSFQDIFKIEKPINLEEKVWPVIRRVIKQALTELIVMRRKEGATLKRDITERLKRLSIEIRNIEVLAANSREIHRERLNRRLDELLNKRTVDEVRLEEEIAYLVERSDITEECVRFMSHIRQFQSALKQAGPVGKKLNFILQELNRESNTIGSKAASSDIARIIVEIKEEIEKVREQVQNIE